MSLKETEKKIYNQEDAPKMGSSGQASALTSPPKQQDPFSASSFPSPELEQKKEVWIREQDEKKKKRGVLFRKILLVVVGIAAVVGVIWLAFFIRKSAFTEDKVKISIAGPEKVKSGETVSIDIDYQNLNRASLKDAVIYLKYSENFKPSGNLQFESEGPSASKFNVGEIKGKGSGKISIQGKFFGARDALVYFEARLEYKSSTFNSRFSAKAGSSILVASSPLSIEVIGPQNAASGNAVTYVVSYKNEGQEEFRDLKIKADFPEGFSFANSDPLPVTGENIWYVGNLTAGQSGQVVINGTINGVRDQEKKLKVFVGEIGGDGSFISFGEAQGILKIIGSPLVIEETINGKKENVFANAGDTLMFKINYQNTGTVGLRDVILSVEINCPVLDYSRLDMRSGNGEFDAEKKIVTWKASEIPGFKTLAPNAQGEINFSVPIKDIIPITGSKDKNFSFLATARMDSPDIPTPAGANKVIASNSVNVKINSKLIAQMEGFFNDAEIANTGPLPPKVGQETTFTMHLKAANVSNDVADGKVTMVLAPGVKWKNSFLPGNAAISFNERTNELVWNIGSVSAGTGIIDSPKELIFQLGVIPSQNQIGDFAELVAETVFSAKDSFTGQALEIKLPEKNTNLTEDLGVGEMGKVAP